MKNNCNNKNGSFRFRKFEAGINLLCLVASWSRSEGWSEKRSSRPYKAWNREVTMCGETSNSFHACVKPLHRGRLAQLCPNSFARGPLLASKNNHGSSHPCSLNYSVPGWQLFKIKNYISEVSLDKHWYTVRSKSFGTDFFLKIEDTWWRHIPFFIQNNLYWHINRPLRGRTVSEKLPKIPLFVPSVINQLRLLGSQLNPQVESFYLHFQLGE